MSIKKIPFLNYPQFNSLHTKMKESKVLSIQETDSIFIFILHILFFIKVGKILKGSLDLISSPSVKIQIMGEKGVKSRVFLLCQLIFWPFFVNYSTVDCKYLFFLQDFFHRLKPKQCKKCQYCRVFKKYTWKLIKLTKFDGVERLIS